MGFKKLFLGFFLCLFLVFSANAFVEAFSQFDVAYKVNSNNTLEVHKVLKVRNIYEQAIVPGQMEFKIVDKNSNFDSDFELLNYSVKDRYGKEVRSRILHTVDGVVIVIEVFTPVLPGFDYLIDLKYVLSFDPKGVLFKNLEVPLNEEISVAKLNSGKVSLEIPSGRHFSFVSYVDNSTNVSGNKIVWTFKDEKVPSSVQFEYSFLPVSFWGIRGSLIFWSAINLLFVVLLFFQIRASLRKRRNF